MESSIYNYLFESFSVDVKPENWGSSFIWIIHSNKIPPHIGFSIDDSYFSVKATGSDFNLPVKRVFNSLKAKKCEFILLEVLHENRLNQVQEAFKKYPVLSHQNNTCLSPILNIFEISNQIMLPDLLRILEKNQLISSIFAFNVTESKLGIMQYSQSDIDDRIEKLQRVTRRKN
jgi:hypothetical protein